MDKIPFITLWDIYKGLLTPTQREITDLYFNYDLTLSEIAEQKGISRQGVSECLNTCKRQLEEYEEKLHFSDLLSEIGKWAANFKAERPELEGELIKLESYLDKNYSAEALAALKDKRS